MRGQIAAHYPQARIHQLESEEDPLRLEEGEQAWSMTLRASGPEYVPLRVFRDDDLLDPGADPLLSLLGALSSLREGERIVARLLLRSLGPDWSQAHQVESPPTARAGVVGQRLHEPDASPQHRRRDDGRASPSAASLRSRATAGCRPERPGRPSRLATGIALALAVGGWAWARWSRARNRVFDPAS